METNNPNQEEKPFETITVPVMEESLTVEKQLIETGKVKIIKTVSPEEVNLELTSSSENIEVERIEVNKYVDFIPETRTEGDTTIISVVKEVLFVEKRLLLTEEIRVKKTQLQTSENKKFTILKQKVEVVESK